MTEDTADKRPMTSDLARKQYRDSSKLAARANLHVKYSRASGIGWFEWIGLQARIPAGADVLDVGCGNGWLWEQGAAQLPGDIGLVLLIRRRAWSTRPWKGWL